MISQYITTDEKMPSGKLYSYIEGPDHTFFYQSMKYLCGKKITIVSDHPYEWSNIADPISSIGKTNFSSVYDIYFWMLDGIKIKQNKKKRQSLLGKTFLDSENGKTFIILNLSGKKKECLYFKDMNIKLLSKNKIKYEKQS